ncbi:MAG: lysoplasmalogenase [Calditrichaeota bacterium]|nr:lysoplasmalogenase [Calditrichota bacterium]
MLILLLTILIAVSAVLAILTDYSGPRIGHYIFKPLTTTAIFVLALYLGWHQHTWYRTAILIGLLFSLAGDIFLMLPKDRFLPGLVSFLIAHLFYISAFTAGRGFGFTWWLFLIVLIYGMSIFFYLKKDLGSFTVPVLVYVMVILTMVWQAGENWLATPKTAFLFAFAGAFLFALSDSTLAVNRFRKKFPAARALVLGSYFLAQWLIALSLR